jgi:hypothetical protein
MKKRVVLLTLSCALWMAAVGLGLSRMLTYENSPGTPASAPRQWPASSRISLDRATMIMVAHPHCPCTRSSMGELAKIMALAEGRVTAYVLFVKPSGMLEEWEKTDLWRSAQEIPGVVALCDEGGVEANRFGSQTSGQILLYNDVGQLLFEGGITLARGREGDNAGADAIISQLTEGTAEQTTSAVFGCPVFDLESNQTKEGKIGGKP